MIDITARSITLDRGMAGRFNGIAAQAAEGSGKGGDIVIRTETLQLANGSQISAASFTLAKPNECGTGLRRAGAGRAIVQGVISNFRWMTNRAP